MNQGLSKESLLFLDFDCVNQLNRIVKTTKAKIVFSTSWRPPARGLAKINRLINSWGVEAEGIGCTPWLNLDKPFTFASRGEEIAAWFSLNGLKEDEQKFVIIDDEDDMETLGQYLIHCTFEQGLTKELADEAITRLI